MQFSAKGGLALAAVMALSSSAYGQTTFEEVEAPADTVVLVINPVTGQTRLVGNNADPAEMAGYQVDSPVGALNPAGANTLADQGIGGFVEIVPPTDLSISEGTFGNPLAVNRTGFGLGNAFDPNGDRTGIQFAFLDENNASVPSTVVFLIPEPTGLALLGLGAAGVLMRRRRSI